MKALMVPSATETARSAGTTRRATGARERLLAAALRRFGEDGAVAVNLEEVRLEAGVSVGALYHHFADKAALVDALIDRSYGRLETALRRSAVSSSDRDGAATDLHAMGVTYVLFAWEHPSEFALMNRGHKNPFEARLGHGAEPTTGHGAFQVLVDAIVACQDAGLVPAGDVQPLALAAWSAVHGLAVLITGGPLHHAAASRASVERMARTVTATLWDGMRRRWDRASG